MPPNPELAAIVTQLKQLNKNLERAIRLVDPNFPPQKDTILKNVRGVVEVDPAKKYIFVIEDYMPEVAIEELRKLVSEYLGDVDTLWVKGIKEVEVKE